MSEESNCNLKFIKPTSSTVSSNFDPHPKVLPQTKFFWKTYYIRNLIKEIESPTRQPAPVQDSEPPRDQGMENLIEPCVDNKRCENHKFDVVVSENVEKMTMVIRPRLEYKPVIRC